MVVENFEWGANRTVRQAGDSVRKRMEGRLQLENRSERRLVRVWRVAIVEFIEQRTVSRGILTRHIDGCRFSSHRVAAVHPVISLNLRV